MASVTISGVDKVYPNGMHAVRSLDLQIDDGQFMVLVGPSGCGKTTALRMVAGLEEITDGKISIGGDEVNGLSPRDRDVAMVFQNYALYPSMTVYDNIAFGLKMRKLPKHEIRPRVEKMAEILGLSEFLERRPATLSGGQRQRVAMGRAIVRQPKVFLMDEPLSNLDAKLRTQMRSEVARIQHELKATTIYVTHDQVEAMTMGSQVAVMRKGVLQQVAEPQTLYDRPVNLFVASFIGSPSMNLVEGTIARSANGIVVHIGPDQIDLPASAVQRYAGLERYDGRRVAVGIRPDDISERTSDSSTILHGMVTTTELLGSTRLVHARINAPRVVTEEVKEVAADVDDAIVDTLERDEGAIVVASFSPKTPVALDEAVELEVDASALHFFDLDTESAIGSAQATG